MPKTKYASSGFHVAHIPPVHWQACFTKYVFPCLWILSGLTRSQVGLLPAGNHQQVPFAYKMFSRNDQTGWDQSKVFKKAFSIDVQIEFVGVWYARVLTC